MKKLVFATGIAALVLGMASAAGAATHSGWDTQTRRTLNYHIDVEMYVDENDPTVYRENDLRTLAVSIDNGQVEFVRTSVIENSTEHFGPYGFNANGSTNFLPDDPNLPDDQKEPPMEAMLLLWVFDTVPFDDTPGTAWSFWNQDLASLPLDQLALRVNSRLNVTGTRYVDSDLQIDIEREGDLQLVDNLAMWAVVGSPAERSAEIAPVVAALNEEDNLFLFGSQVFEVPRNSTTGQTVSADFMYVTIPHSWGTRDTISVSTLRQHLTATLLP